MYNESPFIAQVGLLLRCLPLLSEQNKFALKGGTAINLFLQNMPRLSVDIDLTYVPIQDRKTTLFEISQHLHNMANTITKHYPDVLVKEDFSKEIGSIVKLYVYHEKSMIKIEPNFITRGTLYPLVQGKLCNRAANYFQASIQNIPMLDAAEVYGGKLCAALDRQHPRDLFDVKLLFETSGITDNIRQAFVVYLASSPNPISNLLSPNLLNIKNAYQEDFLNMTEQHIPLSDLLSVRDRLIEELPLSLSEKERLFLLSLKQGEPDYSLLPFSHLHTLPGIKWKLLNIKRMDKKKHAFMVDKLKAILKI